MEPHLTPAKLIGQRFRRDVFGNRKIAVLGYCPPPRVLEKYNPVTTTDQYFIHLSPHSVKKFTYNGINFLSLEHVYGGPVSAATVEELAYYGFEYILAYGLAGGLGTKELKMGDFYLVERALIADGTSPYYTKEPIVSANTSLQSTIMKTWPLTKLPALHLVQAVTGDAIYREDEPFLCSARQQGCDIINCDSSHLYAASQVNGEGKLIKSVECGVISDVTGSTQGEEWDSTLSVMLSSEPTEGLNPLQLTGRILEFYVEQLATTLTMV